MRFLANENIPLKSVYLLREKGHNVFAIIEDSPGVKDEEVLRQAADEKRIILTYDKDYGELIYKSGSSVPEGIVYFRLVPVSPEETAELIFNLFNIQEFSLKQKFTVVERDRVRQRPLP